MKKNIIFRLLVASQIVLSSLGLALLPVRAADVSTSAAAAVDVKKPEPPPVKRKVLRVKKDVEVEGNVAIHGLPSPETPEEGAAPAPKKRLDVDGNGTINAVSAVDGKLGFQVNGKTRMAVLDNGNVGVGTPNPEMAFDLVGPAGPIFRLYSANQTSSPKMMWDVPGSDNHYFLSWSGDALYFERDGDEKKHSAAQMSISRKGGLRVYGDASKPGGGSWSDSSDARLKKNVQPVVGALSRMLQLRGVTYEWINPQEHGNMTGRQMGMIAQDVERVFPEWVGTDKDGFKTLGFRGFESLTVEAIRELKQENEALKARLIALEEKLNSRR